MKKQILLIVMIIAVAGVVSGCQEKTREAISRKESGSIVQNEISTTSENVNIATTSSHISDFGIKNVDVSNWKSYKNIKYNIDIKYPKNWKIIIPKDSKTGIVLKSENYVPLLDGYEDSIVYEGEVYIQQISNDNNLSIIDLIKTFDDSSQFWPDKFKYEELNINKNKAVIFNEIKDGKYGRKFVFIKKNNYIFTIEYLYDTKDNNIEKIFDKIITEMDFN